MALVGPTACGKSAVGVELARRLGGEVVSCDSMQVYRGMPICTQAPKRVVQGIRHHLCAFLEPSRSYSAALFRRQVETVLRDLVRRKKVPILVGGTGLYLRALLDGLFDAPTGNAKSEALRRQLYAEAAQKGPGHLHARLAAVDPLSAGKIHPNDVRRIVRALEVYEMTGQPISALKPRRQGIRQRWDCRIFLIDRDRQQLYQRIEKRVDAMMREGLLREVRRLGRKRLSRTASMALGVREMKSVLTGEATQAEAVELLKKNTRNYAKRQLSWFRHEPGVEVVAAAKRESEAKIAKKILSLLNSPPSPPSLSKEGGMSLVAQRPPSFFKEGGTGGVAR